MIGLVRPFTASRREGTWTPIFVAANRIGVPCAPSLLLNDQSSSDLLLKCKFESAAISERGCHARRGRFCLKLETAESHQLHAIVFNVVMFERISSLYRKQPSASCSLLVKPDLLAFHYMSAATLAIIIDWHQPMQAIPLYILLA